MHHWPSSPNPVRRPDRYRNNVKPSKKPEKWNQTDKLILTAEKVGAIFASSKEFELV